MRPTITSGSLRVHAPLRVALHSADKQLRAALSAASVLLVFSRSTKQHIFDFLRRINATSVQYYLRTALQLGMPPWQGPLQDYHIWVHLWFFPAYLSCCGFCRSLTDNNSICTYSCAIGLCHVSCPHSIQPMADQPMLCCQRRALPQSIPIASSASLFTSGWYYRTLQFVK